MTTMEQLQHLVLARRAHAERLQFFDANLWLGDPVGFPCARALPVAQLGPALRERCLTGGLISHWLGHTQSAQLGNHALQDALSSLGEGYYAIWTGLPLFPAEDGPLPGAETLPACVRGVRIFPRAHNFPPLAWSIGSLCTWLQQRCLPLFLWHTEIDWASLYQLAHAFPGLTLILESQPQKILYHTRALFALLRDCGNVRVELSNFAGQGFLEYAVREFGAQRLIYGSFLPVSEPFVPMGLVLDADITEEEKRLIAGDNLRQLIAEVRV